jgi:hypothetical protein
MKKGHISLYIILGIIVLLIILFLWQISYDFVKVIVLIILLVIIYLGWIKNNDKETKCN